MASNVSNVKCICSKNKFSNLNKSSKTEYFCTCMKNCPAVKRMDIGNVM